MSKRKHRIPVCSFCGQAGKRLDRWDAYACQSCDAWLEPICGDVACEFCVGRPDRPCDAVVVEWAIDG